MPRTAILLLTLVFAAPNLAWSEEPKYPSHFKVQVDENVYKVTDIQNPHFKAHGWLINTEGVTRLRLDIATKVHQNPYNCKSALTRSSFLRGKDEFQKILKHFKDRITGIETYWEIGDNYLQFSKLYRYGVPGEMAASNTWTGQQAALNGFTQITAKIVDLEMGKYKDPQIVFQFDLPNGAQDRSFSRFYAASDSSTRLVYATATANVSQVRTLLAAGVSPDLAEHLRKDMESPLIIAAQENLLEIATLLVTAGADVNVHSNVFKDFRALECARNKEHWAVYEYLKTVTPQRQQ